MPDHHSGADDVFVADGVVTATVDITPAEPLPLFGYTSRSGPSTGVRNHLEANIVAFRQAGTTTMVLVSTDSLYGGELCRGIAALLNLSDGDVLVFGSHTHFAPGVDHALPRLGPTDPKYLDEISRRIVRAIESEPVRDDLTISVGSTSVDGLFVNRRRPTFGVGVRVPRIGRSVTAPHTKAPVDSGLRLACLWSGQELVAVIWGVSCHPVCSPDQRQVSACFPGEVRRDLREHLTKRNVPVLFLQGFSGDVRPAATSRRPNRSVRGIAQYLIAGGRVFAPQSENIYKAWCSRLADFAVSTVALAVDGSRSPVTLRKTESSRRLPSGWARAPWMQLVELGSSISILAVNAEVVHERVETITALCPDSLVLPAGCCNEVIGYWPTDRMMKQGGYEASGSACFFPTLDWDSANGPDALWADLLKETSPTDQ